MEKLWNFFSWDLYEPCVHLAVGSNDSNQSAIRGLLSVLKSAVIYLTKKKFCHDKNDIRN